jgi:outer membrane protein
VTLAESLAIALKQNFGLLSAADAVSAAHFNERAAAAAFYPKLTPSYSRSDTQSLFTLDASQKLPWSGGSISASGTYTSPRADAALPHGSDVQVTLAQPLLRGFGPTVTSYDLVNSRRAQQAQQRSYELARQQLAIDVTAAFYQVIRQRQLLDVARQSLERSENLSKASEARVKVGLASRLDVLRADLQAQQARNGMLSARTALDTALEQFRLLLGRGPEADLEPGDVTLPDSDDTPPEPVQLLVEKALENRLELQESRDQIRDSERALSLARQNLLPQLDVSLQYSQVGYGSNLSDSWNRADRRASVFFTTSYPVERSADRATKQVAELELAARKRALTQQRLQVEAEVRATARNLARIETSIELQRKAVDLAQQQHRLATLRYQRGLASNFDVVDAENNLVTARTALVGLLADEQVARVQLLKSTGTLDVEKELEN